MINTETSAGAASMMSLLRQRREQAAFRLLRTAEVRAVFEWQSFYWLKPLLKRLKKGDGHPVIVFPGFLASDKSTKPLVKLLGSLGYQACGWGLGRNMVVNDALKADMSALLDKVYAEHGRKVSLVGWSLGGIYARELAKLSPDKVRCVISLGSPISGKPEHSNANRVFSSINRRRKTNLRARRGQVSIPPAVPTTSIYSRTDGIVHWRGSVQLTSPEVAHEQLENIELPASHLGLGVNAFAIAAIADRLSQPEGQWQAFKPNGLAKLIYR